MAKRIGMEVAMAVAEAVALCRLDVAAVYPITPNTHVAEHLSDIVKAAVVALYGSYNVKAPY